MSSSQEGFYQNAIHIKKEKTLLLNTLEVLDEEKENILTEVLRCYVCLELPKGKQVRICEEGHHCCLTCHKKIKVCGICRGALLESRNFVVEQLVTKLGPVLGLPKNETPSTDPPKNLPPGYQPCLHHCPISIPAFQMLPHLRANHFTNLLENVRSNPYFGRFSLKLSVRFAQDEKYIWSTYVNDMGLFTMVLHFLGLDFFGCVRMLADETVAAMFRYQLTLKIGDKESASFLELSAMNCQVGSYRDDIESIRAGGNGLKVSSKQLLEYIEVGTELTVFVSVWENREESETEEKTGTSLVCLPERHLHFEDNRKIRRNRNRNMRRKRLRLSRQNDSPTSLLEGISNMAL